MNKYKTLMSNTMLIGIGTMGSKLLMFFMVRFYTEYMNPVEYGTADLITQTAILVIPLISFGIMEGIFRFTVELPHKRRLIFSTGVMVITLGILLMIAVKPLFNNMNLLGDYLWLIVIYTASAACHSLCAQFVRACGNTVLYAVQGLINTILMITFSIIFIACMDMGIGGYVAAVVLADICATVLLVVNARLWRYLSYKIDPGTCLQLLKYSIPLIPTTIFWWVISVSDRYMITYFLGSDLNGLYAVAYKIPTILSLVSGIFLEAWQYSAMAEFDSRRRGGDDFYSKVWSSYISSMFAVCSVIILLSKLGVGLLTTPLYYEAWQYVPVLSVSAVFSSFGVFLGTIYMVTKKSVSAFLTVMAGAVINLILNIILIPSPLGLQGAALATLISYLVVFVIRSAHIRRYFEILLRRRRTALNFLLLMVQTLAAVKAVHFWYIWQIAFVVLILIINRRQIVRSFRMIIFSLLKRSGSKT